MLKSLLLFILEEKQEARVKYHIDIFKPEKSEYIFPGFYIQLFQSLHLES